MILHGVDGKGGRRQVILRGVDCDGQVHHFFVEPPLPGMACQCGAVIAREAGRFEFLKRSFWDAYGDEIIQLVALGIGLAFILAVGP